jgi:hypothetical protein
VSVAPVAADGVNRRVRASSIGSQKCGASHRCDRGERFAFARGTAAGARIATGTSPLCLTLRAMDKSVHCIGALDNVVAFAIASPDARRARKARRSRIRTGNR